MRCTLFSALFQNATNDACDGHPRNSDQLPEGITGFNQLALGRSWLKLREYFVTEYAELEKTQKDHGVQLLVLHRTVPKSHTSCA